MKLRSTILLSIILIILITGCKLKTGDLNSDILHQSLDGGKNFLLNNQYNIGNFTYEYDFVNKKYSEGDNQVRQAGALWGLSLIYNYSPDEKLEKAILRGISFFKTNSHVTADGLYYIRYPSSSRGSTGTVALVCLALTDFLRTGNNFEKYPDLKHLLNKYLNFLITLRDPQALFHANYSNSTGKKESPHSPYFDGETLLALIKAAKYAGYPQFKEIILESAQAMYDTNVEKALQDDPDSKTTKGFYQWGSMAFYEIYTSGWEGVEHYADKVIQLAYWMIDVHKTLKRRRNTAYAYEGIIHAYESARLTGNKKALTKFRRVINKGMYKLTTWQVKGPIQNSYLKKLNIDDTKANGGIMNLSANEPLLRIDVTQHQMHAVILALKYVYNGSDKTAFHLTAHSRNFITRYIRQSITDTQLTGDIHFLDNYASMNDVIVTLYNKDGQHTTITTENDAPLFVCINDIIDSIKKNHTAFIADPFRIRVDIITHTSKKKLQLPEVYKKLDRGLKGFIASSQDDMKVFLPGDWLRCEALHKAKKKNIEHNSKELLKFLHISEKASIDYSYTLIETYSFVESTNYNSTQVLFRGLPVVTDVNQQVIEQAINTAARYLTSLMRENNRFYYTHNPLADSFDKNNYNILRHAGTLYSLAQAYKIKQNPDILKTLHKGFTYLIENMHPNNENQAAAYIKEHSKAKLGGTALALLAMAEYQLTTGDTTYEKTMDKLALHIQTQQENDGYLHSYYQISPNIPKPTRNSIYYPGEACYGLIKYAEAINDISKRDAALATAKKGIRYLTIKRPWKMYYLKKEYAPWRVPPDAWLQLAIYHYYKLTRDKQFNYYAVKITRRMLRTLKTSPKIKDYYGGYYGDPPQTTPAGARGEGLTATCMLFDLMNKEKKKKKLLRDIMLASRFILTMQISSDGAYYLPSPEKAVGAFKESPLNYMVRIDYVQHNMSALIGLLSLYKEG